MWSRLAAAMRRESERIAFAQGLRAAVATITPLLIGDAMGVPGAYNWATLGGFQVSLVDPGGPYRLRATTMLAVVLGGALACAIGSAAGQWIWVSIPLTFAAALWSGLVRVYGSSASSVGLINLVVYLIALASPLGPHVTSLHRAALYAGGGLIALILALFLWPFQPYRPARRAIAAVWEALSDRAKADADRVLASDHGTVTWYTRGVPSNATIRGLLEDAGRELVAIRASRGGPTARGEALLATLAAADRTFGVLVGLLDALEVTHQTGNGPAGEQAASALRGAGDAAASIGRIVMGEPRVAVQTQADAQGVLGRLAHELTTAAQVARTIDAAGQAEVRPRALRPMALPNLIAPVRAALGLHSLVGRHALRLAVGVLAAHVLNLALGLPRGYWMTLTTAVILQPYTGATLHRALQRVIGTVIGGLIAGGLTWAVHGPVALAAVLATLTVITLAVRPMGYGYYTLALTPLFVLIAEGTRNEPHLVWVRLVNTVLGGILAFAAGALLWPDWEGDTLSDVLAKAMDAAADYVRAALTGAASADHARRTLGIANSNAEVVMQRVLTDRRTSDVLAGSGLNLVTFLRRIAHTTSALTSLGATADDFSAVAANALRALAAALRTGETPGATPDLLAAVPANVQSPAVAELLGYLARQIEVLYASAESARRAAPTARRAQPVPA
jgi:uncharacterized membrane protein YccC